MSRRGKRVDRETAKRRFEMYIGGMTARQIAEEEGGTPSSVLAQIYRSGAMCRVRPPTGEIIFERIKELYLQGASLRELSGQSGIEKRRLSRELKKRGVRLRGPGEGYVYGSNSKLAQFICQMLLESPDGLRSREIADASGYDDRDLAYKYVYLKLSECAKRRFVESRGDKWVILDTEWAKLVVGKKV